MASVSASPAAVNAPVRAARCCRKEAPWTVTLSVSGSH